MLKKLGYKMPFFAQRKIPKPYFGSVTGTYPAWEIFSLICLWHFILTRRYGPLLGPTSSSWGGLWPSAEALFALRAKKIAFNDVLAHFWEFLVSSRNRGNF